MHGSSDSPYETDMDRLNVGMYAHAPSVVHVMHVRVSVTVEG